MFRQDFSIRLILSTPVHGQLGRFTVLCVW
jgi:hypothetical protein